MGKFDKSYKMKVLHQWMPVLKAEKESCYCLSSELYIEFIVYKASLNTLFPSHFIYLFFLISFLMADSCPSHFKTT